MLFKRAGNRVLVKSNMLDAVKMVLQHPQVVTDLQLKKTGADAFGKIMLIM